MFAYRKQILWQDPFRCHVAGAMPYDPRGRVVACYQRRRRATGISDHQRKNDIPAAERRSPAAMHRPLEPTAFRSGLCHAEGESVCIRPRGREVGIHGRNLLQELACHDQCAERAVRYRIVSGADAGFL